ncbi:MAG TPA: sigma factor, partial [Bacteroidia bacterium]|nr:sigma factor [Bacteroidia bacterium]
MNKRVPAPVKRAVIPNLALAKQEYIFKRLGLNDLNDILRRCSVHDKAAQALLYNWLAPKMLGIAMRYLQDRDQAEDVMQDSLVKVFMKLKTYRGDGNFEGWAKRIAVNTALNALKEKNKIVFERDLTVLEHLDFPEEEQSQLNPDDIAFCLSQLSTGYRTI